MPNRAENTPLIATVPVRTPRPRYRHSTLRRFCTISLTSILLYSFLSFAIMLLVDGPPHHRHRHRHGWWSDALTLSWSDAKVSHEELREILLNTPDGKRAQEWSRYYTSGVHLAGKNYSQVG